MGPGDLARALCGLEWISHPKLLVGLEQADDAGVYQLTEDCALVQTVDFFTPIVDDPYTFGQVAAVNALSDVYAMGGKPITAMNIVCFPNGTLDMSVLQDILRGGLSKLREAEVVLVGGHSVSDPELKYGLAVTGLVHPKRILTKSGAKPGDVLVLTKPLGTGIVNTAAKREQASERALAAVVASMTTLNRKPSELILASEVHACTDVTGFGLIGHAFEMIEGTGLGFVIHAEALPVFPDAEAYVSQQLIPGGLKRNRDFRSPQVLVDPTVRSTLMEVLYDPQTSGGLLAAIPSANAQALLKQLQDHGSIDAAVVGDVIEDPKERIQVDA